MPECLECKTELEFDDTVDIYADSDIVIFYEVGHCPKCGKEYKWRDVYNFSHFEDLEEV
jgi:uncharacterized protein with PIN domain